METSSGGTVGLWGTVSTGGQLQLCGFLSHWIEPVGRRVSEDDVIRIHSE